MDFTWTLILHSKRKKTKPRANKQTESQPNKIAQQTFFNFIFTLALM